MAKDKFLNEKSIETNKNNYDQKNVKYSVYELLRYFLIFNGYNILSFSNQSNPSESSFDKKLLKFILNINASASPFNYSFFFYLIANKVLSSDHKIELGCIALLQGSDPNIMPNIAQSLLSQIQIDPPYKLCDIFKMFLGQQDYERTIKIFRKYSKLFDKAEWDDLFGNFLEKMKMDEYKLGQIERNHLSSLLSSKYRQRSNPNFTFRENPYDEMNFRKYNPEQLTENTRLQQIGQFKKPSLFSRGSDYVKGLFTKKTQPPSYQQMPNQSILTTVPLKPSLLNRGSDYLKGIFTKKPQPLSYQPILTTVPYMPPEYNPYAPQFSTLPVQALSGGSKIKLRTFHFLEPKSYNEHAFRAEKPIIAGKMAYDFLRTHYKLKKGASIMFTIEDRIKNKKYNYIGEKVNNKIIIKST
jgi:hypothetical protein